MSQESYKDMYYDAWLHRMCRRVVCPFGQSELGTELEHKNSLLQELMSRDVQQEVLLLCAVIIR